MGFLFSEASPKVKAQKDSFPVNTISAIMGKSDLDKGAKVGSFESGSNVPSNTPTYPVFVPEEIASSIPVILTV